MKVTKKDTPGTKEGALRLLWFPQIPCEPFAVLVESLAEAAALHDVLAAYDIFQFEQRIKPDFSNNADFQVWECDGPEDDGGVLGWSSWYDPETGDGFEEAMEALRAPVTIVEKPKKLKK